MEDFSETVAATQRALLPPSLAGGHPKKVDRRRGRPVRLAPADLALYAWMARRREAGTHPIHWDDSDIKKEYLAEYGAIVGPHSGDYERAEQALNSEILRDWFEQRKSRPNRFVATD